MNRLAEEKREVSPAALTLCSKLKTGRSQPVGMPNTKMFDLSVCFAIGKLDPLCECRGEPRLLMTIGKSSERLSNIVFRFDTSEGD